MKKRKGFSLIELVVTIAIIAILSVLLVPSVISSLRDGKINNDESYVKQLCNVIHSASQESKIYYNFTRICDECDTKEIKLTFKSEFDGTFAYVKMEDPDYDYPVTGNDLEKREKYAADFESSMLDYINGTIEMTPMQSDLYRNRTLTIIITPTTREYQTTVTSEWEPLEDE